MLLTRYEINERLIIANPNAKGFRHTTYDATVGEIIQEGRRIRDTHFQLPPRGIVWVVSSESFSLPANITGLATLRTTWTHSGVLALNVGVVDPGWRGPLAAAIVNFGSTNFEVTKGDGFLRLLFHEHTTTSAADLLVSHERYISSIMDKSKGFSSTFLNIDSLAPEIYQRVFKLPSWAVRIGLLATAIAVLAIFVPIALAIFTDFSKYTAKMDTLEDRINTIESNARSK